MKSSARLLALVGLLTAGAAAPAFATWVPVTTVPLNPVPGTTNIVDASRELPSRVDSISLRADNSDVACRDVTGIFRSGQTMQLFRGMLPAGRENVIWMMPVHRDLARVDFHCRALNGPGDITLSANIPGHLIITNHVVGELEPVVP